MTQVQTLAFWESEIESLNNNDNAPLDLLTFCVVWWDLQSLCQILSEFCLSFLKFTAN